MWRWLSGGARAVVIVVATGLVAVLAALTFEFAPAFFDVDLWMIGAEGDLSLLPVVIGTVLAMVIALGVTTWLTAYLTVRHELDRRGRRPEAGRPTEELPASGWPIAALCGVSAVVWFAFVGWDGHKDADAFGNETGPWEAWQIFGLVVSLAVVAAIAARRLPAKAIVSVMSVTVSVLFLLLFVLVMIPDRPYDAFNGLWIVVAGLIFLGMIVGTALITSMARPHAGAGVSR